MVLGFVIKIWDLVADLPWVASTAALYANVAVRVWLLSGMSTHVRRYSIGQDL